MGQYHQSSAGFLLPHSPPLVDEDRRRWSEKNSQTRRSRLTSPEGEHIYREREQLKVCTKTLGLNFLNILCIKAVWHRLMMLEGLDEAERVCEGVGGRGVETAVSLLALCTSLEANSRLAIS